MKKIKIILFVLVCSSSLIYGQTFLTKHNFTIHESNSKFILQSPEVDTLNEESNTNLRAGYFYMTFGLADLLGIGFGYQIDNYFAIGLKAGGYWVGGGTLFPTAAGGVGIKVSRTLDFKVFNNLNFETIFYLGVPNYSDKNPFIKGSAYEINIGYENKTNKGLNFFWSVGAAASFAKDSPSLYMPNLKIGFNFNF